MVWSPAIFLMNAAYERGRSDAWAGKEPDKSVPWHTYMDGYREVERSRKRQDDDYRS